MVIIDRYLTVFAASLHREGQVYTTDVLLKQTCHADTTKMKTKRPNYYEARLLVTPEFSGSRINGMVPV